MPEKRKIFDGSIGSNTSKGTQGCTVLFGYQNKFKTKTSVSRMKRIAQMLERGQSLLQYCNVFQSAKLVFYKGHGSHTPLQDEGDEPMMDLVTGMHTRGEYRDSM